MTDIETAILEAVFDNGGIASPQHIRPALKGAGAAFSDPAIRGRMSRLALQGFVVKNGREYDLTMLGREHFLDELTWREPKSPLVIAARKRKAFVLSAEVESLDEGGYLATCSEIPGCHAEGATVAEALENLEDAARLLLALDHAKARPSSSPWSSTIPGAELTEHVLPMPA